MTFIFNLACSLNLPYQFFFSYYSFISSIFGGVSEPQNFVKGSLIVLNTIKSKLMWWEKGAELETLYRSTFHF